MTSLSKKYKEPIWFITKMILFTIPLFIVFSILRSKPGIQASISESFPVYDFSKFLMVCSRNLLLLFHYDTSFVFTKNIYHYGVFAIQIKGGVQTFIGFSCLGIGLMWIFMVLIIAFSGNWKYKLFYILSGIILIQALNVLRISYLTWLGRNGESFDTKRLSIFGLVHLDHHALFNLFIYIVIFFLFILWGEVFSKKNSHK
jgi:exosortase/archaeosortase family protein